MKIGFTGISLPEGKVKFNDDKLNVLAAKCQPEKVSPYFFEFVKDEFIQPDVIVVNKNAILNVLIPDIEKCELRIERTENELEKNVLKKALKFLETETPLCAVEFGPEELKILKNLGPVSLKPVVTVDEGQEVNEIIKIVMETAGYVFFYTAGKKEVHAWLVKKETDIVTCAGQIHTDLARGFIRADIVKFNDFLQCHNMNECKDKGVVNTVDKSYLIQPDDIIEIRFNV